MPMNNRLLVPQKLPLLLDYAPGAAAAYSLRSLSNSYVGPVVTVRRSTDSAERDFTATEVSDNTLAAWCSGGDGFVKTWHDQSQHGRDATQTTTAAQPKIVASGVVILENGKPALLFDGVDDYFVRDLTATNQSYSAFFIYHHKAALSAGVRLFCLNASAAHTTGADVGALTVGNDIKVLQHVVAWGTGAFTASVGATHLLYFTTGTASSLLQLYGDGIPTPASSHTGPPASTGSRLAIMARADGLSTAYGAVSELLIYPTDMTALRTRIEGDLAWYY